MKKFLKRLLIIITGGYLLLCPAVYFFQESLIFFPQKLDPHYIFNFDEPFEELTFNVPEAELNGLLFHADSSKGLIFYLHGNAGSLGSWGNAASVYTNLGYDVLMLDYRGYGKSTGEIYSEEQLFEDNQAVYNTIKQRYSEENIHILGYSIGSGMAAKLAADNQPNQLILQAPYHNLKSLMQEKYPFLPPFLLRYPLKSHEYLQQTSCPITIIHGEEDVVIPFEQGLRLSEASDQSIRFIPLRQQGHNGISDHAEYFNVVKSLLEI